MAIKEQLEILNQGTQVWNNWRESNRSVVIDLTRADLRNMELTGVDLSLADLRHANFAHTHLEKANLASAKLQNACLAFADLDNALLAHANLTGADLRASNLRAASLEDANLERANLANAHLENATLAYANLTNASLMDADITGINLTAANMEKANITKVKYDYGIIGSLLKRNGWSPLITFRQSKYDLILDTTIRCKGVNASSCFGNQRFKIFLQDQDYLEELLETTWGRITCLLWWLSADCGRSISRWAGWSVLIAMMFAFVYYFLGPNHFASAYLELNIQTMIYYSVVTFTTLGFGDITPKTSDAAMLVMTEVIIGYIMLGGLITIFASKLSRRSG